MTQIVRVRIVGVVQKKVARDEVAATDAPAARKSRRFIIRGLLI
jgi:hypothetical protein